MRPDDARRRSWLSLFMCSSLLLAACGGGGGDEGGGGGADDEDATGIWNGTVRPDGQSSVNALAVVVPDGSFALLASTFGYLYGTGSTDGDSFSADATGFAPAGESFASGSSSGAFTLDGTVFEANRLDGSFSGAGESGTLALTFNSTATNKPASLAAVGGSYAAADGIASIAINNGAITFNATTGTNCVGSGTIRVADTAARNLYSWSMTLTGCVNNGQFRGVAFLADIGGVSNSQLVMLGTGPSSPFAVAFNR